MNPLRLVLLVAGAIIIAAIIIWEKRRQRRPQSFHSATAFEDAGGDAPTAPLVEAESEAFTSPNISFSSPPPPKAKKSRAKKTKPEKPVPEKPEQTPEPKQWEQLDLEAEVNRLADAEIIAPEEIQHDPQGQTRPQPQDTSDKHTPQELVFLYTVAPAERPLQGKDIRTALQDAGFALGDMGLFHYSVPQDDDTPATLFSVANIQEPGNFDSDTLDGLTTRGLTMFMQLPGPLGGLDAFDKMLEVTQETAEKLGCCIKDESREDLSPVAIENIKERIIKFNLELYAGAHIN